MTFPAIAAADTTSGSVTSNTQNWTITYPANIAAGDLLLLFIAPDGNTAAVGGGGFSFVQQAAQGTVRPSVWRDVAAGGESGTFSFDVGASEQGVWRCVRIPAATWFGDLVPSTDSIVVSAAATGSNTAPDPGSVSTVWTSGLDVLFIAFGGSDHGNTTYTGFPTNYTQEDHSTAGGHAQESGGAGGAALGVAYRQRTVTSGSDSENPAAFAQDVTEGWGAITVAVRGVDSGPSTQGLTVGLIESTPAIYAPTLVGKNAISLGLIESVSAIYAPTLLATNTLALGLIDSGSAIYALTVTPGAVSIELGVIDSGSAIYAPTITPSTSVALPLIDSGSAIYAPTLALAPYPITLPLIDSGSAIYAPTLATENDLLLGLIDAGSAVYAPVLLATNTLELGLIDAGSAIYEITVANAAGVQAITLGLIDAGSAIYAPTLATENDLALPLIDAGPALYAPSLSMTVALGLIDAGSAIYAPVLAVGPVTVSLPLIDAGSAIYAPTLLGQNAIALDLVDAGPAIYAPTLTLENDLVLDLIDAGAAIYSITITTATQNVVLPLLDAGAAIYEPTLTGLNAIALGLIDSASAIYAPTFELRAVVSLPLIDSGSAVYAITILSVSGVIAGVTRDANGTAIGNATVRAFRTADNVHVGTTVSDAQGNYSITLTIADAPYYLVAYRTGSPDIAGTTLNTLVPS